MQLTEFNRFAVPVAVGAFFFLAMVWPTLRLRKRGVTAMVLHRPANPFQRVIGFGMALFMAAVLLWALLNAAVEPSRLQIWSEWQVVAWVGWGLNAVGLLVVLIAQRQMGMSWRIGIDAGRTQLVTQGLFRVVRNPIFAGMFLALLGLALATPSPWTLMALLNYALLISLQVRLEEQHLLAIHGADYLAYASHAGRFVPVLGRVSPGSPTFAS